VEARSAEPLRVHIAQTAKKRARLAPHPGRESKSLVVHPLTHTG
jgi:hypothetical protein